MRRGSPGWVAAGRKAPAHSRFLTERLEPALRVRAGLDGPEFPSRRFPLLFPTLPPSHSTRNPVRRTPVRESSHPSDRRLALWRERGRFADLRRSIYKFAGRHIVRVPFYQPRFRQFDPALLCTLHSRVARAASAQDIAYRWWRAVISPSYARQSFTGFISLDDRGPVLLGDFPSFT